MSQKSRTYYSLRNARYGLAFYILGLILAFAFRRYFIQALGADLLGLNSTAQNLLGFLNVAELGLGAAIAFALYKPLYNSSKEEIKDIISIQGWFYRIIALVVIVGTAILLPSFPRIFAKVNLPIWYAYATFGVLLYGTLLSYFFNYRQVIFTSDQRDYRVTFAIQAPKLLKMVIQTVILYLQLPYAYSWWLILEVLFATISTVMLEYFLRKDYPWLKTSIKRGLKAKRNYPDIIQRTKQLICHKMAGFVLVQSGPLLVFAFTTPKLVTVYTNYLLVMMGLVSLTESAFRGIGGSIGNLVASGDHNRTEEIFRHLYTLRLWLAAVAVIMLYLFMPDFVKLWVGEDLLMDTVAMWLWLAYTLQALMRLPDTFISAYGMYQDIWAPITEAVINLGLSLVLGYQYGLIGILIGINISMLLVVHIWKPIFLYIKGFRMNPLPFFGRILRQLFVLCAVAGLSLWGYKELLTLQAKDWSSLIWHMSLFLPCLLIISMGCMYALVPDYRKALKESIDRLTKRRQ